MATATVGSDLVSQEDIDVFARDGAICVRGIIGQDWIERMREAIARVTRDEGAEKPRFVTMLYLWEKNPDFRAFSLDSPLAPVAAAVLRSERVNLFADQLLVKEPGTGARTPWHQDMPYWPLTGTQLCTIWVAFDPVTRESGAVEYVRGSHLWNKWYRPESFSDGPSGFAQFDWETIPDFDALRDRYEFLQWDVEPGDCIIHHPLVVHGAGGNAHADRARRAIAPRYAGDDVRWHVPDNYPARSRPVDLPQDAPLAEPWFPRVW